MLGMQMRGEPLGSARHARPMYFQKQHAGSEEAACAGTRQFALYIMLYGLLIQGKGNWFNVSGLKQRDEKHTAPPMAH